jgi:hypothetical protein
MKWNCCIGLPYGISYWQAGDSSKQNVCFKMALARAQQELDTKTIMQVYNFLSTIGALLG